VPLEGRSSLCAEDVVIVNFSCPGGEIRGCPWALSSEPLLGCPLLAALLGVTEPDGAESRPLTAVKRAVGDSGCFSPMNE